MIDFGYGCALGPLDSSANETIRRWRNDVNIRKWCRQSSMISDLDQASWFDRQNTDPSIKMFSVVQQPEETLSGVCGLTSIDLLNRRAEFSLYIAPQFHGMGLGRAALKTLCAHGFQDLNLNLIWGESFDENPAQRMFEDVGFSREGTRREFYFKGGRYIDAHLYSITAKDYRKAKWK